MQATSRFGNIFGTKREATTEFSWAPKRETFMERHQVVEVLRGFVLSSALWGALAVGVYAVYTMVLGGH